MLESLFNKVSVVQIYEKETPTQVFYREYCEIFKSSFFYRAPPVSGFEPSNMGFRNLLLIWNMVTTHAPLCRSSIVPISNFQLHHLVPITRLQVKLKSLFKLKMLQKYF